jgi:hypothetical protein
MTILSIDDLVASLVTQEMALVNKTSQSNAAAGVPFSLWNLASLPAAGAVPTSADYPTKATAGALINFTSPGSGEQVRIARGYMMSSNSATDIQVHDRLAQMAGLSGTVTTAQTVSLALPSNVSADRIGRADYSEVQWWVEIYTDIGTSAQTLTVTYTDVDDNSGQTTTVTIGATTNSQNRRCRLVPIIGAGSEAIKSIQSVQLGATTGTAGNFGITATRAITGMSLGLGNSSETYDWAELLLPIVPENACLFIVMFPGTSSTGNLTGNFKLVRG